MLERHADGTYVVGSGTAQVRLSSRVEAVIPVIREELAITVHGKAVPIDLADTACEGFRRTLLDIYLPRYGPDWESFLEGDVSYARIAAERMFAFAMPAPS